VEERGGGGAVKPENGQKTSRGRNYRGDETTLEWFQLVCVCVCVCVPLSRTAMEGQSESDSLRKQKKGEIIPGPSAHYSLNTQECRVGRDGGGRCVCGGAFKDTFKTFHFKDSISPGISHIFAKCTNGNVLMTPPECVRQFSVRLLFFLNPFFYVPGTRTSN